MEKIQCEDGQIQDSQLNKSRIELDTKQVRHVFGHVFDADFDDWLKTPLPQWGGLTAQYLIETGRAQEIIYHLEHLWDGRND